MTAPQVAQLAALLREIDGNHSMGAGTLAEKLIAHGVSLGVSPVRAVVDVTQEVNSARREPKERECCLGCKGTGLGRGPRKLSTPKECQLCEGTGLRYPAPLVALEGEEHVGSDSMHVRTREPSAVAFGVRLARHLCEIQSEDGYDLVGQETNDLMWEAVRHYGLRAKMVEHAPTPDCPYTERHAFAECGKDGAPLEFEPTPGFVEAAPSDDRAAPQRLRLTVEREAEIRRLVDARDNLGYDSTGTQEKRELLSEIDALRSFLRQALRAAPPAALREAATNAITYLETGCFNSAGAVECAKELRAALAHQEERKP